MRYAMIEEGSVVNVILWDGETDYPDSDKLVLCPEDVSPGWGFQNGEWVEPILEEVPDPTPEPNTAMAEARTSGVAKLMALGLTEEEAWAFAGSA